jgi:hypothetical protein
MFQIVRDGPAPPPVGRASLAALNRKYPFPSMQPNDHFAVPAATPDEARVIATRLSWAIQNYRRDNGKHLKFAVRRLADRVGVWRIT